MSKKEKSPRWWASYWYRKGISPMTFNLAKVGDVHAMKTIQQYIDAAELLSKPNEYKQEIADYIRVRYEHKP